MGNTALGLVYGVHRVVRVDGAQWVYRAGASTWCWAQGTERLLVTLLDQGAWLSAWYISDGTEALLVT